MSVLLCLVVMRELDEGMQHIDLYDCVRVPCVCVCDSSRAPLMTLLLQLRGVDTLHISLPS